MVDTDDQVLIDVGFIFSNGLHNFTSLTDNGGNRIGTDFQVPGNFSYSHAIFVQKIDSFMFFRFDHKISVSPG